MMNELVVITRTMFQIEHAKMAEILAEETVVRASLSKLDEQNRAAHSEAETHMEPLRAIGADIMWQGWVARQRTMLNMRLAQVLVKKAEKSAGLRRAFGKQTVAEKLAEAERLNRHKSVAERQVQEEQARLALLSR